MYSYLHHIGDYAAATAHLTLVEDAIYRRALDLYYLKEEPLPLDINRLARYLRVSVNNAVDMDSLAYVVSEFFYQEDDGYTHSRCELEIDKYRKSDDAKAKERENTNDRKARSRQRRAELFEAARTLGIVLKFNATIAEIQAAIDENVTVMSQHGHSHVTSDDHVTGTAIKPKPKPKPYTDIQGEKIEEKTDLEPNPIPVIGITDTVAVVIEPTKPKTSKPSRPKSLPDDYGIDDDIRAWGADKRITDAELADRMAFFINYCKSHDKRYVDFNAAFKNSCNADWAKLTPYPVAKYGAFDNDSTDNQLVSSDELAFSMGIAKRRAY